MCEAAAQLSSCYTQRYNLLDAKVIGFGGMEEVRFREPVVPGDRLRDRRGAVPSCGQRR